MITGLSADNARPVPQQTAKRKTEKQDNFADQLTGARPEPRDQKNDNRTERKNSGRDSNREESGSAERESRSQRSPSDLREKREAMRSPERVGERPRPNEKRLEERRNERAPQAESQAYGLPPSQVSVPVRQGEGSPSDDEAPIVVEAPKDKEVKLPDFFSKASLEQGSAKTAKVGPMTEAANTLASMKQSEGVSRQEAMQTFVEKMNDELGIPPEKLLAAFAKLDDKAMQASPEQSMGAFLQALDLDAEGEAKAGALYSTLLKTTGDSLVNEKLAGLDSSVNFDVVSPRDASLRKLNHSLNDLNNSFFRKADPKEAQKNLEAMDLALAKLQESRSSTDLSGAQASQAAASAALTDVNLDSSQADSQALAGLLATAPKAQSAMFAANSGEGESDLADLMSGGRETATLSKMSGKDALKSAFAEELAKDESDDLTADVSSADVKADAKSELSQALGQDVAQPTTSVVNGKPLMGPADMMMNRQSTPADEQENIKDLIKEAQVLVKRGGGEMKMEMKPEGMGNIQLRVNVENGQVHVQMLTDNESAKHLLEKGLGELKSNLAQHELKVQSMTVDVGNDTKTAMDQRASQDQARQHARQFASDFMQDFRDTNQGFRQGLFENRGWKSYARGKGPESVQPEQVARASTASSGDTSKRLNLVA